MRLAVCIRGDLRNWDICKDHFFSSFEKDSMYDQIDYYVSTYDKVVNVFRMPYYQSSNAHYNNRTHPGTVNYALPLDVDKVKQDFEGRSLIAFNTFDIGVRHKSTMNQFYLIYHSMLEKRKYEVQENFIYDHVVSARCDVILNGNNLREYHDLGINGYNGKTTSSMYLGNKVDFAQDLQYYGKSEEMDALSQIYFLYNSEYSEHICIHRLAGKYLNNSSVGYQYPCDIRTVYRRDGLKSVPITRDDLIEHQCIIDRDYHDRTLRDPFILTDNSYTKVTFNDEQPNEIFSFEDIISPEIAYGFLLDYYDENNYNNPTTAETINNIALNAERITDLSNTALINSLKEHHSLGKNIIITSQFSVECTSLVLDILNICHLVSKFEFKHFSQQIIEIPPVPDVANPNWLLFIKNLEGTLDELNIELHDNKNYILNYSKHQLIIQDRFKWDDNLLLFVSCTKKDNNRNINNDKLVIHSPSLNFLLKSDSSALFLDPADLAACGVKDVWLER